MPTKLSRPKREPKLLLQKAVNSLILSVEHFNRPWDQGRVESVLILLDHSFEMLLKAAILYRGGKIRERRAKQTIGFDACLRVALSNASIKFLTEEQVLLLQTINSLRDAAQHHLIDISEHNLYIQAQAGLTLFRDIMNTVFAKDLRIQLPERVLPLSTKAPTDLATVFDSEVEEIKKLLRPGKRKRVEALAKLRGLAIIDGSLVGERLQPSEAELKRLGQNIRLGRSWNELFPGVAAINITATGTGPSLDLRISKTTGMPITMVPPGTPGATVIAIKRVNELDYYNLNSKQICLKLGLNAFQFSALVHFLKIKDNPDHFKQIQMGRSAFNRYSEKTLNILRSAVSEQKIDAAVKAYKESRRARPKPS